VKRKWVIRGFFIALIVLIVGAWIWNADPNGIYFRWGGRHSFFLTSAGDDLWLMQAQSTSAFHGVSFGKRPHFITYTMCNHFLDFMWGSDPEEWWIALPFWFLTSFPTLALFFVWRKTRKPNPSTAFPVEAVKK
jgi:hypothetical protein